MLLLLHPSEEGWPFWMTVRLKMLNDLRGPHLKMAPVAIIPGDIGMLGFDFPVRAVYP